jgi:probable addiction module antidote protein
MVKTKNYKEHLLEQLQKPKEAAAYLNAALHDDDPHVFLLALRDIAEARGGMSWLADQADLNRESLYRTLSLRGNPRFFNLLAVLDVIGLELSVQTRPKRTRAS